MGDFNGDAQADLATANNNLGNPGDVSVLLGSASGSFAAAAGSPFPAGSGPSSVAVGDFNGDTDPDLAVANLSSNNVSVLLGGTGGSFAAAAGSPFPAGSGPSSVAVGDFNGDTDPDLAVANLFSFNVSVLLGGTGGSFAAAAGSPFPAGLEPQSVAVGDFNGDTDPDLAFANQSNNVVTVLLGGTGGSFAAAAGSPFPAGSGPRSVAVGEFNGDSDPDLAVANFSSANVTVLLGGTGGSFAAGAGSPFPAGSGPRSVAVGEFNGDTDPDLAVANVADDNISVLLGGSVAAGAGGTFAAAPGSPFPAGDTPSSVVVGQFNGDPDPDLAVTDQFPDQVSVLLGLNAYVRPMSASSLRAALVPAYRVCGAPNRTHGPPLDSPSCAPPEQLSQYLTVGTPDANGQSASSVGFMHLRVITGNPATVADEADVGVQFSVTDVRDADDLSDYTGELVASMSLRHTDREIPGTLTPTGFRFVVPCVATGGAAGATCSVNTTADAITPGIVKERDRAIWQLGQVIALDGGEDGLASTTDDNTIFLRQGVYVP